MFCALLGRERRNEVELTYPNGTVIQRFQCCAGSRCLFQCSQVSTEHIVPDSRWGEVKVFGEGKSGSKSHTHLCVTLSDDLGKDLCWTALQQMVIEPGQVPSLH